MKNELKQEILELLNKVPKPSRIDTINKTMAFKAIAEKAKKLAKSGNLDALQQTLNELRLYYKD